jgi:uncharacterized spore protein YtfJ
MALPEVIKTALEHIQHIAKTETIFGEPIKAGDITLIPVSKVSIGFAAGGAGKAEKSASGAATGGGINVVPIAFISINGNEIKVHPLGYGEADLATLLALAPDAVKKMSNYLKKKFGGEGGENRDSAAKEESGPPAGKDDSRDESEKAREP